MAKNTGTYGLLAEYTTAAEIYHACEKVRDAGYAKWDAYTPFPVHGLDKAMGAPPSVLPWIVLVMAITGMTAAITMQGWMMAVDYKYIISNKPYFSWQAYVPVTFELTILFSAFGAVFGMLGLNRLPQHHHELFNSERFARVTDDRFFIAIEATDPKFNLEKTRSFLESTGATAIEAVSND